MIATFKEEGVLQRNIDVTLIGYNGKVEIGKGDGVFRDALTTFWNQFFNSLAVGAQEKIPAIRHDYQKDEWEAIARILLYGYVRDGYFPLSLSLGFLVVCLFGDDSISGEFCYHVSANISQMMRETLLINVSKMTLILIQMMRI